MPIFHDRRQHTSEQRVNGQAGRPESGSGLLEGTWTSSSAIRDRPDGRSAGQFSIDAALSDCPPISKSSASLSRGELIEQIKRAQSPPWLSDTKNNDVPNTTTQPSEGTAENPKPLLPALEIYDSDKDEAASPQDNEAVGQSIERPRSALHSGDFTEQRSGSQFEAAPSNTKIAVPSVAPWLQSFAQPTLKPLRSDQGYLYQETKDGQSSPSKAQSPLSTSFSQGIVLMPPTSPLAQQSNNTDLDFSPRNCSRSPTRSPERNTRRHTFSPNSFQSFRYSAVDKLASDTPAARHFPRVRREGTFPYQAHQPRRSLTSISAFQPDFLPQTPQMRPRRPSISSESSPLQHAPMVGSYEESILRGRMSTTPSRPLNFIAQIGVLGKGQCKPNLKCPPHVAVPFPAVFYSYQSGSGRTSNDSPSPYVGHIDIENSLAPPGDPRRGRRKRRHVQSNSDDDEIGNMSSRQASPDARKLNASRRKREKLKRRSTSPKAPPGGSYRIPQQGQLQIVIKNPNKTAVKLFLVPYDLSDMEPGQKTFIRQRSYSAGPIIDMPLANRKNLGTDRPEASLSNSEDPNDRPVLRYLIHVNICCPSRGRYYLYKSIRVVFANRVPDGKEKLRNEIQLQEPRYTAYKPSREIPGSHSSFAAQLAGDKALQRRSGGFGTTQSMFDNIDGIGGGLPTSRSSFSSLLSGTGYEHPVRAIPFALSRLEPVESRPVSRDQMEVDSDGKSALGPSSPMSSPNSTTSPTNIQPSYQKILKGEAGYGGNFQTPPSFGSPSGIGESLLARRLKGLDVQQDSQSGDHLGEA